MLKILKKFSLLVFCCSSLVLTVVAQQQQEEKKPAEGEKPPEAPKAPLAVNPETEPTAPVDPKTFLIGPEDILLIRVWREAEISGAHSVRPDGRITLPLIGDVVAGGLTPAKLKESLTQSLSEYLKNPQVSVFVQQVNSKKYYITGEVTRTGAFPLITPITVFEAIGNAGGLREFANPKKIVVWRSGKRIDFNYKDVVKGKKLDQNIQLEPGDHIIVP
jgi:polysaccharide export outer membrane protein